jgi:hypothetical protein
VHAPTHAELEHLWPFGQQLEQVGEVAEPGLVRDPRLPIGEVIRDRVVAALDYALRVVAQAADSSIARRAASNCSSVSRM